MHDIKQWLPYLNDLLGEDEYGQRHVSEVHTLAETINNPELAVLDRVRLIDWLERLDSTRQVFLLPWIMEQLCNPSPIMCERLLTYFETMLQGEGTDVVQSLGNLFRQKRDYSSKLIKVLNSLSSCLYDQTDVDKDHHLRALPSQRVAAFALATLTGVQNWIDMQPDAVELTELVHDFFEGENEEALRELLKKWLFKGPLFFRYLLVDWSAASGVSLIPDFDVSQTLMRVYRDDTDPLITCSAIQGYASVIPASYLSIASQKISSEIAEFKERAPKWHWWRSAEEATRMVSVGQLRALFTLALKHYPAQGPIKQLLRFLITRPQKRIGFWKQRNWSRKQWQRVLSASILMFGSKIKIKAKARPKQGTADLGRGIIVGTEDPHGFLAELRGGTFVWLTPVPDPEQLDSPLGWSFQITELVGKHYDCAEDLSALITPSFSWFKQRNFKRAFSLQLQTKTMQEFDVRGDWMSASCEMVTRLLHKSLDQDAALDKKQFRELLAFLSDMGITASLWNYDKNSTSKRNNFKNLLRSLFLNELADNQVFKFLYPDDEVDALQGQFLAGIASTALNAIPGSLPSLWISENRRQLLSIAQGNNNHIKHRAPAAIALLLRPPSTDNYDVVTTSFATDINFDPDELLRFASGALALLNDEAFSELVHEYLTPTDGLDLAASPENLANKGPEVHLWAEFLARNLIANHYDKKLPRMATRVCLAALLHGGQRGLGVSTRMRLLEALSIRSIKNINLRHLLSRLLHDSTSSEFQLYISHLRQQQRRLLDAYGTCQ